MEKAMQSFENWKEVTKGIYRYVIGANACYEIHLMHWNHDTDILSANFKLYIVGNWRDDKGESFFERELLFTGPLMACLVAAAEDNEKNNS